MSNYCINNFILAEGIAPLYLYPINIEINFINTLSN